MNILKAILFLALFILLGAFIPADNFVLYAIKVPILSFLLSLPFAFVIWWYRPKWFIGKEWQYMEPRERAAYMKKQKERREKIRKFFTRR